MKGPILHIVRRYGPVGGMESYVWHLTSALAIRGHAVIVICEQLLCSPVANVEIVKVDQAQERHRWKSMLFFREAVERCLRERFSGLNIIVHSHERSLSHHVTTFHGPPMQVSNFERYIWRSRRVSIWQQMESAELFGPNVKMILPVSNQVKEKLVIEHPKIREKEIKVAWPGVEVPHDNRPAGSSRSNKEIRLLFVGREWKRKGLDFAVKIVDKFRRSNEFVTLFVKGPEAKDIPFHMRRKKWMVIEGWQKEIDWESYDLLIHPARNEPFGMVVVEARAHGLPVVMSTNVGASEVVSNNIWCIPLDAPVEKWIEALDKATKIERRSGEVGWSWDNVIKFHIEEVYEQLNKLIYGGAEM